MKRIVLDRRTLIIIVVLILVVVTTYLIARDLLIYTGLTRCRRVERIGNFTVLDDPCSAGKAELYDSAVERVSSDYFFNLAKLLIGTNRCRSGELLAIEYGKATLYINCTFVKIRVNNSMIREGEAVIPADFAEYSVDEFGRTYTHIDFDTEFVRVYYTKLRLTVQLPENVVQGLTVNPEEYLRPEVETIITNGTMIVIHHGSEKYCYRIANVPLLYYNATILKGRVWYIVKLTLSINGVNVTDPGWRISGSDGGGGHSTVLAPFDGYMSESEIMKRHDVLKPFLEITGNRVVTIEWYIEIYVYSLGEFEIEFTFGLPALRVVKSLE